MSASAAGYVQIAGWVVQSIGQAFMAYELREAGLKARRRGKLIAAQIILDSREEAELRRIQGDQLGGTQRARFAAAGVQVGEGSPFEILAENAMTTEVAVGRILELGSRRAQQVIDESRALKRQLRAQAIGGVLSSTAASLGSAGGLNFDRGGTQSIDTGFSSSAFGGGQGAQALPASGGPSVLGAGVA